MEELRAVVASPLRSVGSLDRGSIDFSSAYLISFLGAFAEAALRLVRRRADLGDAHAQSVLALTADLQGGAAASQDESDGAAMLGRTDLDPSESEARDIGPDFIFDLALAQDSAVFGRHAALFLAALHYEDEGDPEPALGLAVCAIRLGRTREAHLFAMESVRRGGKHPRAFCIAGLCEFDFGDKNAAQQHLAVATRLARARGEFRDDMRIAQRLLLIINFGGPRRPPHAIRQREELGT